MRFVIPLISLVISCAAFAFSLVNWRERRKQDQRDLFLKVHERLIDIDLQRGRRILYSEVTSPQAARSLLNNQPNDYDLVNRALSMMDVAALYVKRGYIDKALFMGEWAPVYARARANGLRFIAERTDRQGAGSWTAWPHFQALAAEAASLVISQP